MMAGAHMLNIARLGIIGFLLTAPVVLNAYWLFMVLQVVLLTYLALSFDIAYSYSKLLSFCQGLFFAVSAYIVVYTVSPEWWGCAAIFAGVSAATLIGMVVGLMLIRMQGHGAVIATVIIASAAFLVANALRDVTGGEDGRSVVTETIGLAGWEILLGLSSGVYYVATIPLVAIVLLLWKARSTMSWTVVRAIAQNDARARLLGYNVELRRLIIYAISAAISGLGGAFYALAMRQVTTHVFDVGFSVNAMLFAVVGGLGTDIGTLTGALLVLPATELIAVFFVNVQIFVGLLMTFVAVAVPRGVVGTLLSRIESTSSAEVSDHYVAAIDEVEPAGW